MGLVGSDHEKEKRITFIRARFEAPQGAANAARMEAGATKSGGKSEADENRA